MWPCRTARECDVILSLFRVDLRTGRLVLDHMMHAVKEAVRGVKCVFKLFLTFTFNIHYIHLDVRMHARYDHKVQQLQAALPAVPVTQCSQGYKRNLGATEHCDCTSVTCTHFATP